MPAYDDFGKEVIGIDGVNENDDTFIVTINVGNKQSTHNIVIKKDSSKIITPTYATADMTTDVVVSSTSSEIPLDTQLQANKLTSGKDYERIMNRLAVENSVTYDLKLYSSSLNKLIEEGSFEVKLPIPEELKGKNLIVYYVDANDNVTEHEVTVKDGFAIFTTDHFSIYTLAEVPTTSEDEKENNKGNNKEENKEDGVGDNNIDSSDDKNNTGNNEENTTNGNNPQTGDNIMLFVGIFVASLMGIILTTKVRKNNNKK